jgi:hypothetical protein
MQTKDNDFPYTSDDPILAPVEGKNAVMSLTPQQLDDLKATLRLMVGSALNGTDAYLLRLRSMQAAQESVEAESVIIDGSETFRDQLRYLLLGVLFETPDVIQRGLVRVETVSSKAFRLVSRVLSPVTNSWIFSPVRNQVDRAAERGEKVLEHLVMKGRQEERNSRMLTQQKAIDDLINDVLEYVIMKTEATQIIEEGGIGMAGGMLDEFRDQSAAVDSIMNQKFRSVFRKHTPAQSATPPSDLAEGK